MQVKRKYVYLLLPLLLVCAAVYCFPYLFTRIVLWQREFNQLISAYLHQIKQAPLHAGGLLILLSFVYGVLHALGPGHGKFILASYLSTHQSQLKTSMRLSLLSSLMQGVVAVSATSVIVVMLRLSSAYFKFSQLWLERIAFGLILLLGVQWVYQSGRTLWQQRKTALAQRGFSSVYRITSLSTDKIQKIQKSAVLNRQECHRHDSHCGCGHQHLPDQRQLAQAADFKSQFLIVLSIGMRPCSGAIFILFFAYMLDLYLWGVAAALVMALGTGLTLSAFALMVQYARSGAVKLGKWYLSPGLQRNADGLIKLTVGTIVIFLALGLLYASTQPVQGGAALFGA